MDESASTFPCCEPPVDAAAHEVVFAVLQLYGLSTLAPVRPKARAGDLDEGKLTSRAVAVAGRGGRQLL